MPRHRVKKGRVAKKLGPPTKVGGVAAVKVKPTTDLKKKKKKVAAIGGTRRVRI